MAQSELSDADVFGAPSTTVPSDAPSSPRLDRPMPFPDGMGGVMPGGEATRNPDTWRRWLAEDEAQKAQPSSSTASPRAGELSDADVFGAPAPKRGGILANIGAGTNEAAMSMLGAPVDVAAGALNLVPRGLNAIAGTHIPTIEKPVGGTEWWENREHEAGIDPRDVAATTPGEQIARAAGAGAASMVLPGALANGLPALGGVAGEVQRAFGAGSAPSQALVGAASGAAGESAEHQVPDWAKPYANIAGQIAGGSGAAGVEAASRYLAGEFGTVMRRILAPLTESGRTDLAASRLQGAATDRGAAAEALGADRPELVPGSAPTTFQLSGDQGLGSLEREAAARRPDLFMQRIADQNAARVGALEDERLAPRSSNPQSVVSTVRAAFNGIDDANALAEFHARNAYERAQAAEPVPQTAALQAAQNEASHLGGDVPAGADAQETALQRFGNALRNPVEASRQEDSARRAEVSAAVDPGNTLVVRTLPIRDGARQIIAEQPKSARPMEGEPAAIFSEASAWPATNTFRELTAFRSRITSAMRDELSTNGRTPAYAMMSDLLGRVHATLDPAVQARAAEEAAAVRAGKIAPEQTMAARLQDMIDRWRADAQQSRQAAGGGNAPGLPGSGATMGTTGASGLPGTGSETGAGFGNPPRGAGISEASPDLTPNWTQEAADRDRAAQAGWREHFETYRSAPGVGEILAPGQTRGEFRIGASRVPSLLLGGKGAAERIQSYLRAGGDRQALTDYAAFDLMRNAGDANGTLNPAKAAAWLRSNAEAATVLPELRSMGTKATEARAAFDEATIRAKEARDASESAAKGEYLAAQRKRADDQRAFQQSAAGKFLGESDPVAAIGRVLRGDTAIADMRKLTAMTSRSVSARMGLRRAVVEYVLREMKGNALAGDTGIANIKADKFQTFMRRAEPALAELFPSDQIASMKAVAADLQRASKSWSATKIPGGSNTAQDVFGLTKDSLKRPSILAQMFGAEAAGAAMGAPGIGSVGAIGSLALSVMRKAGFQKVDDMVTEAMLHPEVAKALLLRPLPTGETRALSILQQRVRAVALAASAGHSRVGLGNQ